MGIDYVMISMLVAVVAIGIVFTMKQNYIAVVLCGCGALLCMWKLLSSKKTETVTNTNTKKNVSIDTNIKTKANSSNLPKEAGITKSAVEAIPNKRNSNSNSSSSGVTNNNNNNTNIDIIT